MVGACGGSSTLLLHMLDLWVVCAWVARNYILYGRERFARILKVALRMRARAIRSISVYRVGGMVMACYSHAGRVSTSFCAATGLFRYGDLWLRLGIEILLRSSAPPVMWPPLRRVWAFPIWYMHENRELNEIWTRYADVCAVLPVLFVWKLNLMWVRGIISMRLILKKSKDNTKKV